MKEILELTLTLSLTGLAVTTYTLLRLSRLILELRIQIAEMTLPTPVACVEEEPEILYDSDFDERIIEMTRELEKLNTPGNVYDLPHASVRTPSKFSPEYAD